MAPRSLSTQALVFALAVLGLGAGLACASGPLATLEAAQLYRRGSAALERGDSVRAIADLERAGALAPGASEIQNHLGAAYAAAGRDAAALDAFRRAVVLDCDNAAAQANLRDALAHPVHHGGGERAP